MKDSKEVLQRYLLKIKQLQFAEVTRLERNPSHDNAVYPATVLKNRQNYTIGLLA